MNDQYLVGSTVTVTGTIKNAAGALADPATIQLAVTSPGGTVTVYSSAFLGHPSVGTYTYPLTLTSAGQWLLVWTATSPDASLTSRLDAFVPSTGITLREIEQETARRVGPFGVFGVSGGAGLGAVGSTDLQSSLDLGDWDEAYVLRRGRQWQASESSPLVDNYVAVSPYTDTDRVRRVAAGGYAPGTGTLAVDRVYTNAPILHEEFELHTLHPAQELRVAVLHGLARCYFVDRATVTTTGAATERDLTASLPWLTEASQIFEVSTVVTGSVVAAYPVRWWRAFDQDGHVWAAVWPDAYPNPLLVTARRPHVSWVNGASSTTGPLTDEDTLTLPLDYAVAAAVVEAWKVARPKLAAAAASGLAPTQQEAAAALTLAARAHYRPEARRNQLHESYGPPAWSFGWHPG